MNDNNELSGHEESPALLESPVPQEKNELDGIKKELASQRKMLTVILVFVIILTSVIVIYLLYKMTIGSIFGKLIGLVTGLFAG